MSIEEGARRRRPARDSRPREYAHPIVSRARILEILAAHGAPLASEAIAAAADLTTAGAQEGLERRLAAMARDAQLRRTRTGAWGLLDKLDLVRGRVIGHRDGYGFLAPDEGGEDLFLSPRQMRSLMHGDRAMVRIVGVDRRGRPEASLVDVIERGTSSVVGRYFVEGGVGFVRPDNRRLHHEVVIPADAAGGAHAGEVVVAEIVEQPGKRNPPIGRIVEVLGEQLAPGMEIDVAIRAYDLPVVFSSAALAEARACGDRVTAKARRGRTDLRALPLVTIDGADARDFDDAVFCERRPKGWKLTVAIADVSAYVAPSSALDEEARRRGNSVYFPQRVIPMLPEALSNGLCSLNPGVDRLCMACEMHIDADGKITRSVFREAVMRSQARLTYHQVAAIVVAREPAARAANAQLAPHLDELHRLYKALLKGREARGTLVLDLPETRIVLGRDSKVRRIEPLLRNDAHRIIEECMVAANVAAARFVTRHRLPMLYRVHDGPTADRLEDLRAFLAEFKLALGGGERPRPRDYAALLERVAGRPEELLVQTVLLRSLAQAVYSPINKGHFGLALPCYAHFTSPIRRYPDLLLHRAIKHALRAAKPGQFPYTRADMVTLGEQASMAERRADEATRDAVDRLKCEYMRGKVGEVYAGTVTGVVSFGLFVQLDEVFVEGLLHVSLLGSDYYHFDPVHHRLVGERGGRTYRLADRVSVRVLRVDLDERKIDFELAGGSGERPSARQRRGPGKRRRRHG